MKKSKLCLLSFVLLLGSCSGASNNKPIDDSSYGESISNKRSDIDESSKENLSSKQDENQLKYEETLQGMKNLASRSDNNEHVFYGSEDTAWKMKIQNKVNQDRPRLVGIFRTYNSSATVTIQFNEKPGRYPVSYEFDGGYTVLGSLYLDSQFSKNTKLSFTSYVGNDSDKSTSLNIISLIIDGLLNQFTLKTSWKASELGFVNYSTGINDIKNEEVEHPHLPDNYKVNPGKGIYFGNYPQSVVSDSSLKTKLSQLKNGNKAGSVLFYDSDDDGTEEEYAVVDSKYQYKADDGSKVETGIQYYKYEPISWISIGNNKYVSEKVLEYRTWGGQKDSYEDEDYQVHYVYNQYETSSIRKWLNGDFMDICFTKQGQEKIADTLNVNGGEKQYGGKTIYKNTIDKVYLLSEEEVEEENFSTLRKAEATDYFAAQEKRYKQDDTGKYTTDWWLRSPSGGSGGYVPYVGFGGFLYDSYFNSTFGIRPALTLKI